MRALAPSRCNMARTEVGERRSSTVTSSRECDAIKSSSLCCSAFVHCRYFRLEITPDCCANLQQASRGFPDTAAIAVISAFRPICAPCSSFRDSGGAVFKYLLTISRAAPGQRKVRRLADRFNSPMSLKDRGSRTPHPSYLLLGGQTGMRLTLG